ncbi:NAD binding domain of 6-phosphogluconate dehydrogenase [Paraburkholderia fungorum]|uniref:NAD binding domain of 6-phosphogluconate dehydrogenase n=1 Tax=Paraburkholderia fungorum TaxID=134537 RepID=A0A1H1JZR9_9BURK|nr:NAD(P)-dependent oxidoreductase [Paraburkholderia fungorum]SDR55476.1 NAD binding domain of 6-phosphogluconate dehydrogenase [Paraburkholderia fungorum]
MKPIVAIPSAGEMGAALAAQLTARGVKVLTMLEGRSEANRRRAELAGMTSAKDDDQLLDADFLLSVLPPAHAAGFARRIAPALIRAPRRPLYVDCNAISPDTALGIAKNIEENGGSFVDASIIGFPAKPGATGGPKIFASGPLAPSLQVLGEYGLEIRVLDAPVGAASSLKMCYGGLTKGLVALGSALILAAQRTGSMDALNSELQATQPHLFAWLQRMVPDMFRKSHRWVAEVDEVESLMGDRPEHEIFAGASALFERLAADERGDQTEIDVLAAFFTRV